MAPLKRDLFLKVRVTAEEKRMLEEIADAAGVSASDWVRLRIREAHQAPRLPKAIRDVEKVLDTAMGGKRTHMAVKQAQAVSKLTKLARSPYKQK